MQDLEDLQGESDPPDSLLIEAPGGQTRRNNTTLLVKPDRVARLSCAAAAMALFTLQTDAPAGGRGNLTSLRGGGPLTILVQPGVADDEPLPLWHLLWANVPKGTVPTPDDLPRVFPWLAPTRTADRHPATTPGDHAHELQAFWGMPRRIRLDFAGNAGGASCDLTGAVEPVIVTGWRQRPNGVKYVGWDHPLSPAYKDAKSGGWLPVHPQPGGIGYRHWASFVLGDGAGNRKPAPCMSAWPERAADLAAGARARTRLFAAGYDMDNMKARAFVESEMPLPGTIDDEANETFATFARRLVTASEEAARALRLAIRNARYGDGTGLDAGPLATAYEGLWAATQDAFFDLLGDAMAGETDPLTRHGAAWCDRLRGIALALFDEAAPLDPGAASFDPARIVRARRDLWGTFRGYSMFGRALFEALELPLPEPAKKKTARRKEPA
jgi:CRISPR system Cascade subunit CasA